MTVVLDASLALAWCFREEANSFTTSMLSAIEREVVFVPPIWPYEICNSLVVAKRRNRITEREIDLYLASLRELQITLVPDAIDSVFLHDRALAEAHGLSAYDASYLDLARRLRLPLATLDGSGRRLGLKQAASRCGVELYPRGSN